MIRLSKETDYGILLLSHLAVTPEALIFSARDLANETRVPLPMVSKVLKALAREGVLVSHRGPKGGYALAKKPEKISIAEVIAAMEGPVGLTECIEHPGDCMQEPTCQVRHNWAKINQRIWDSLDGITLAEMAAPPSNRLVTIDSEGAHAH